MVSENEDQVKKHRRSFDHHLTYKVLGLLLFGLLIVVTIKLCVVTISSGHCGVLWQRFFNGTRVDRFYDEGLHVIFPWDRMIIYDIRAQTIREKLTVLSSNGLPIEIEIAAYFKIDRENLPNLHKNIGPNYAGIVIAPMTKAIIRNITGQLTPEEIFSNQKEFNSRLNIQAYIEYTRNYLKLLNIYLMRISLPETISKAIEQKLVQKEKITEKMYAIAAEKNEAIRKEEEAKGIKTYNKTVASSISPNILTWHGIDATRKISESPNAKTIIIGGGKEGLPVILNEGK